MMNSLLKIVKNHLKTKHDRVYHEEAPNNAKYPYIVFEITQGLKNSMRDDLILMVDIWDRNKDTMPIEDLTDTIDKLFHEANLPSENVLPTFYRETRLKVDDPDKTLKRRQLRFAIHTYFREV